LLVVLGFVALAIVLYLADAVVWSDGQHPAGLGWLGALFGGTNALSSLLATVATSIITVTSITFSLLLLAVQQGAAALTNQVFDQFLRRRSNQFHFGFFVGLSIFALAMLVTVSKSHTPIFGTLAALLLTAVALCMIVVLIYNTIDQMRPSEIIRAIHHHVLASREGQISLLKATCRRPRTSLAAARTIKSEAQGNVSAIDVTALSNALESLQPDAAVEVQVELLVEVGTYVAFHDPLIRLRSERALTDEIRDRIAKAAVSAVKLDDERDLGRDPAYGIEQLATIGWTSVSTAHSNPQPGILVCRSLRDILARWCAGWPLPHSADSRIVYADTVVHDALGALESLAVVASESMQSQTLAEFTRTMTLLLGELPTDLCHEIENIVLRSLSSLGDHVLTRELDGALVALQNALQERGLTRGAEAVELATSGLARSVGRLNSRGTRASEAG
jgi:uncharacterized membrane protein